MKNERTFRKTVTGGFNAQDVTDYLSELGKRQQKETAELRAELERLRRERDQAVAQLGQAPLTVEGMSAADQARIEAALKKLMSEKDALLDTVAGLTLEAESEREEKARLQQELSALRESIDSDGDLREREDWIRERDNIRAAIEQFLAERDAFDVIRRNFEQEQERFWAERQEQSGLSSTAQQELTEERNQLRRDKEALQRTLDSLREQINTLRLERDDLRLQQSQLAGENVDLQATCMELRHDIEQAGITRESLALAEREAQDIVEEAAARAEATQQSILRLIGDTRLRYDRLMQSGQSVSQSLSLELDRLRELLAGFSETFLPVRQEIERLESDPRPRVQSFDPPGFTSDDDPDITALPEETAAVTDGTDDSEATLSFEPVGDDFFRGPSEEE